MMEANLLTESLDNQIFQNFLVKYNKVDFNNNSNKLNIKLFKIQLIFYLKFEHKHSIIKTFELIKQSKMPDLKIIRVNNNKIIYNIDKQKSNLFLKIKRIENQLKLIKYLRFLQLC